MIFFSYDFFPVSVFVLSFKALSGIIIIIIISYQLTKLWFAGGGSLFAIHGDCEAYDTRTDRWHMVASMSTRRARVGVAAIGNRLYAVGGWVIGLTTIKSSIFVFFHVLCALDKPISCLNKD